MNNMSIVCKKENLVKGISGSINAINSKVDAPILKYFHLKASEDSIRISAYDKKISIETVIEAQVITEGEGLVDAVLFKNIVGKMPNNDIHISIEKDIVYIECEKSQYKLKTESAEFYPTLPQKNTESLIKLYQNDFKKMISEIIFSVSQDETKPISTSALMRIKNNVLNLVSIDGYRLSISANTLNLNCSDCEMLIPGDTLKKLSSLLSNGSDDFEIYHDDKFATFIIGNTQIVSRLLEGQFIEYDKLTSFNPLLTVKANKSAFLSAIERASILSQDKNSLIKLHIRDNSLLIAGKGVDDNNALEKVDVETVGDSLDIGFNSRYLCEGLKAIDTEEVNILFTTGTSPAIFKPVDNDENTKEYTYLLLPVRLAS